MRMAIKWYAVPGERRFSPDRAVASAIVNGRTLRSGPR